MNAFRRGIGVIRAFSRAYLGLNVAYYGLILVAMIVAVAWPSFHSELRKLTGQALTEGPLTPVAHAYQSGFLLRAMIITFLVNFFLAAIACISIPSLIVPFSGLVLGIVRAVTWGLLFAPIGAHVSPNRLAMGALVAVLIFLEGQGYVLTMLAAYVQSRLFLRPHEAGKATLAQGYVAGLKTALPVYLLVALVLAVAAIYEASVAILVLPRLR